MSRKKVGKGAGVHAIKDLDSHARKLGHYYKQSGTTEELSLRAEITQMIF